MQQSLLQARCQETIVFSNWGAVLAIALLLLLLVYAFLYLPASMHRALLEEATANRTGGIAVPYRKGN